MENGDENVVTTIILTRLQIAGTKSKGVQSQIQ